MKINKLRFSLYYLISMFGFGGLYFLVERFADFELPTGAMSAIAILLPTMYEGKQVAKSYEGEITNGEKWKAAYFLAVIIIVWSVLTFFGLLLIPEIKQAVAAVPPSYIIGGLLFVFILTFVISRVGFGMGVKNGSNQTPTKTQS